MRKIYKTGQICKNKRDVSLKPSQPSSPKRILVIFDKKRAKKAFFRPFMTLRSGGVPNARCEKANVSQERLHLSLFIVR